MLVSTNKRFDCLLSLVAALVATMAKTKKTKSGQRWGDIRVALLCDHYGWEEKKRKDR